MKRLFLALLSAGIFSASSMAQNIDDIKNMVVLGQYKAAKEKMDQAMTKPKFTAKPEAYILHATVLSGLSGDSSMAGQADQLRKDAMAAYDKYLQMDPKKELINQPPYNNPPISFYSFYFNEGIKFYNKKEWSAAAENFRNTVIWSDYIIENKMATMQFDTTANLLAGAAYQNAQQEDTAVKYFTRLTDRKIAGDDNEFMYQFLVGYYFRKYDIPNFEKAKAVGQELYPKSEYFKYSEEDFILSLEDPVDKMKRIETKLAADPTNAALTETYGLMLFDQLNGEDDKPKPANYDELEQKMITYLTKSAELTPGSGKANYYLGNHYINKGVKINESIRAVTDEIRKANANAKPDPKTGKLPPPPKELTEKRSALQKDYDAEVDKALPYLLKSAEAYSKNTAIKGVELQTYKRLADQLILIYGDKKAAAKLPADKAKYEAEEKKWSDVYSKISH